ncbi:unnamed protein product [Candida verbasci]|uniref:Uncharacterized protein n=1 Tax=Candida verbasci TaxID=1227364 RepID=A0A9W4TTK6_9ASCO|nr:unnamed protein product [Candida verbasci]
MVHLYSLSTAALIVTTVQSLIIPDIASLFNFNDLFNHQIEKQIPLINEVKSYASKLLDFDHPSKKVIPDHYIIVLNDNLSNTELLNHQVTLETKYEEMMSMLTKRHEDVNYNPLSFFKIDNFLTGYTGYFTKDFIENLSKHPHVKFIEQDSVMSVNEFDIQKDATWGISRVSHRENLNNDQYLYDSDAGKGVTAYVVDTGIKVEHDEFEGRAVWGDSFAFPKLKVDGHGHGTHVAGTIGSKTYGIAKNVNLVAVGVMSILGTGSTSDIIKGLEFCVQDHQQNIKSKSKFFKGSVVNMSIGGGISEALDLAVNAATKSGLNIAVAAGNDNQDACNYSPARASGPITVGATTINDAKADFSNFGKCVDVFAPGENIESTFIWSDTTVMSGTSMASPHVAGLLAYYLSLLPGHNSEFYTDPSIIQNKVIKYGTKGIITGLDKESPNNLIYNGGGQNLTNLEL